MKRVYFIRPVGKLGPIKIGCSDSPKSRAKQISSDRKEKVRVIADAPGGFTEEMRLHRQFADTRMEGEWFASSDGLMAVIDHVIDTGELPPPVEEDRAEVMQRLYLGGQTLKSIGDQFGMTRERVRQILRKHDCPSLGHRDEHKRKPEPLSADEREYARLYSLGTPPRVLNQMFPSVNRAYVLRRTGTPCAGISFWNTRPDDTERTQEIARQYNAGVVVAQIARNVGLSATEHVYYYLRKAGIQAARVALKKLSPAAIAEAVSQYRGGACITTCAANAGVTPQTMRKHLVRSGVKITREEGERRRIAAVRAANIRRHQARAAQQAAA